MTELTTLAKAKQGPVLLLSLEGRAQDVALDLDSGEIADNNSMKIFIKRLNKIYKIDKLTKKSNAIKKFESYQHP